MGHWILPQVPGIGPGARGGHAAVTVGTIVLVFGGSDRAPVTYDDLWMLDTAGGQDCLQWTRITPSFAAGCKVQPRSAATLTAVGTQVYLYGGQEPVSDVRFGDVKVLDTTTWTWSDVEVQSQQSPPPRHSHTTTCLAGQCLLVYGGSGYSGTLSDLWIFNPAQAAWTQPSLTGTAPPGREMHCAAMVGSTRLLVFGGRAADGSILCDAALLDASSMQWIANEPTPFPRCAHCCCTLPATAQSIQAPAVADDAAAAEPHQDSTQAAAGPSSAELHMLVYGGFSGESVEGDVIRISGENLELELLHKGPRKSDTVGSVPPARFAAAAVAVALPAWPNGPAMCVFGGVTPELDLNDVAIWVQDAALSSS